jgi:hypothetical protein
MAGRVRDHAVTVLLAMGLIAGCTPLRQSRAPVSSDQQFLPGADVPTAAGPGSSPGQGLPPGGMMQQAFMGPAERTPDSESARGQATAAGPEKEEPASAAPNGGVMVIGTSEPTPQEPVQPAAAKEAVPPDDPVVVALRYLLERRPIDARKALDRLDPSNQELLLNLLPLVARCSGSSLDKARPQELATLLQQVESLELPLRARAPLRMGQPCFCRAIHGFGCYEPLREQPPAFAAAGDGQPGELVQVYVELSNFTVEPRDGEYVAHLVSSVEVRDIVSGKLVWCHGYDDKPERSRSPWRDHFIRLRFSIPPELKPGTYTLWVQVQDVLARPSRPPARRSLMFRVIAQGSVAGPQTGSGLASK